MRQQVQGKPSRRSAELRPDLLLLDVQMPKLDGFEVLELVGGDVPVVFVTAYDEFALKAFEVHAVDYLLKPFRRASARGRPRPGAGRPARPGAALGSGAMAAAAARRARDRGARVIRDGAQVHVLPVEHDRLRRGAGRLRRVSDGRQDPAQGADPRRPRNATGSPPVRAHPSIVPAQHRPAGARRAVREGQPDRDPRERTRKLPVSRTGYQRFCRNCCSRGRGDGASPNAKMAAAVGRPDGSGSPADRNRGRPSDGSCPRSRAISPPGNDVRVSPMPDAGWRQFRTRSRS